MNVTFFIGNGFDLACGLNTSYTDFLSYYLNVKNKSDNIKFFKDNIAQNLNTWADAEFAFGQYTERYRVDDVMAFRECYDDFINHLSAYLGEQEKRINVQNLPREAFSAFEHGLLYFDYYLPEESKEKLIDLYNHSLIDERVFNILTFNYTNLFGKLYYGIQDKEITGIPSTLLNGKDCLNFLNSIVYVHGDRRNPPLVFGVDNESQVANKDLLALPRFSRSIIKPDGNKQIRNRVVKACSETIEKSLIICVYGMSIGVTDTIWWKRILEWLKENPSHQLVQFAHAPNCIKDSVGSYADALDDYREH
ncbi:MAG: AbiH family protein, partial [Eubacteriales bacterium]|nr:AbiH family protein [Eubacteriales bacterium]